MDVYLWFKQFVSNWPLLDLTKYYHKQLRNNALHLSLSRCIQISENSAAKIADKLKLKTN